MLLFVRAICVDVNSIVGKMFAYFLDSLCRFHGILVAARDTVVDVLDPN